MTKRIPRSNPKNKSFSHRLSLALDVSMIVLVILDLSCIAFDSLFEVRIIREGLFEQISLSFCNWYAAHINENFLFYESIIFVNLFLAEYFIRWIIAAYKKTYSKWFFYPFVHWYDALGCIPISAFRVLRFFRIFVLLYKLHRWKIINLNDYALFKALTHYYDVIMEEASDRVAIHILNEAREELQRGRPITEEIIEKVLMPRKKEIVEWTSLHIQESLSKQYQLHRPAFRQYLREIVHQAVEDNKEMGGLDKIPVLGPQIAKAINSAVCDIVFKVIDKMTNDLSNEQYRPTLDLIVGAGVDLFFELNMAGEESNTLHHLSANLINESVDLIIKRVEVKNWKKD